MSRNERAFKASRRRLAERDAAKRLIHRLERSEDQEDKAAAADKFLERIRKAEEKWGERT